MNLKDIDSSGNVYSDGTYKVGSDIPAGEYKFMQTDSLGYGYVERAADSSLESDSIIGSGITYEVGQILYVTVNDGEYLTVEGGKFIKYKGESSMNQLTDTDKLYLEYWGKVHDYLDENTDHFTYSKFNTSNKPYTYNSLDLSFKEGLAHITLSATTNFKYNTIRVHLRITKNSNENFDKLFQEKELIESEMGFKLEWVKSEDKKSSKIVTALNIDLKYDDWDEAIKWHFNMAEKMYSVFSHRLKNLKEINK